MAYMYREFSLSSNSARSTCQVVGNKLYTVVRPTSLGVASYMQVVDLATETIATTVTGLLV